MKINGKEMTLDEAKRFLPMGCQYDVDTRGFCLGRDRRYAVSDCTNAELRYLKVAVESGIRC